MRWDCIIIIPFFLYLAKRKREEIPLGLGWRHFVQADCNSHAFLERIESAGAGHDDKYCHWEKDWRGIGRPLPV